MNQYVPAALMATAAILVLGCTLMAIGAMAFTPATGMGIGMVGECGFVTEIALVLFGRVLMAAVTVTGPPSGGMGTGMSVEAPLVTDIA